MWLALLPRVSRAKGAIYNSSRSLEVYTYTRRMTLQNRFYLLDGVNSFPQLGKLEVELFLGVGDGPLFALRESLLHRHLANVRYTVLLEVNLDVKCAVHVPPHMRARLGYGRAGKE